MIVRDTRSELKDIDGHLDGLSIVYNQNPGEFFHISEWNSEKGLRITYFRSILVSCWLENLSQVKQVFCMC